MKDKGKGGITGQGVLDYLPVALKQYKKSSDKIFERLYGALLLYKEGDVSLKGTLVAKAWSLCGGGNKWSIRKSIFAQRDLRRHW